MLVATCVLNACGAETEQTCARRVRRGQGSTSSRASASTTGEFQCICAHFGSTCIHVKLDIPRLANTSRASHVDISSWLNVVVFFFIRLWYGPWPNRDVILVIVGMYLGECVLCVYIKNIHTCRACLCVSCVGACTVAHIFDRLNIRIQN